jgi:hypothetical protein
MSPGGWTFGVDGLHQCTLHQVRRHPGVHRMADHLTGVEILHASQIQPPFHGRQWSERPGVVALSPSLSSPNRTCTSQRIRLPIQALLNAKATSA